jgi:hypothetical protein
MYVCAFSVVYVKTVYRTEREEGKGREQWDVRRLLSLSLSNVSVSLFFLALVFSIEKRIPTVSLSLSFQF